MSKIFNDRVAMQAIKTLKERGYSPDSVVAAMKRQGMFCGSKGHALDLQMHGLCTSCGATE